MPPPCSPRWRGSGVRRGHCSSPWPPACASPPCRPGAGLLAHGGEADLARLRAEVTSRGGTTEAALRVFEDAGLRATVARALEAAALRGRELAAAHPDPFPNRRSLMSSIIFIVETLL